MSFISKIGCYTNKFVRTAAAETIVPRGAKVLPKTVQNADGSLTRVLSDGKKVEIINKDGITMRNVYDSNGNKILEDTKKITVESVGDKTVRTKEINRKKNTSLSPSYQEVYNYKAERIYKDNKLLGMRETEISPYGLYNGKEILPDKRIENGRTYVTKSYVNPNDKTVYYDINGRRFESPTIKGYAKAFVGTGKAKRVVGKYEIDPNTGISGRAHANGAGGYKPFCVNMGLTPDIFYESFLRRGPRQVIDYNKKGLPMPYRSYWDETNKQFYRDYTQGQIDNMSLKDMRAALSQYYLKQGSNNMPYVASSYERTAPDSHLGLESLNKLVF